MCGIIGYIGKKEAVPILLSGLKRMEYRGYDSSGLAILNDGTIQVEKKVGKISELEKSLDGNSIPGNIGLGHTRWATHGMPTQINAHPHIDSKGNIALIHNGIIENYMSLRQRLEKKGHKFRTETDTETLAHLIEDAYHGDLLEAVQMALAQVQGTYGLAVISDMEPDKIIAARMGSPLIIGVGEDENFVASDLAAIIPYTRNAIYLEDEEVAMITADSIQSRTLSNEKVLNKVESVSFQLEEIEKGGYDHFMLKEIMEQPRTLEDSMRGRLLEEEGTTKLGGIRQYIDKLSSAKRIIIVACGTSWHSALIGEYMLEEFARVPVEVEYASEFRYRDPIIEERTIVIAITQSGETADTLAALREARRKGASTLAICNVVGSSIAREAEAGIYIHAGPEIGVASTKAFSSQVTVLALLAILLGRMKGISAAQGRWMVRELKQLPNMVTQVLENMEPIKELAAKLKDHPNFLYLGRGFNFPIALEGALKLKEISYIHAEGYPAAEMKHGPIALIDKDMPVVFIATQDGTYEKVLSNIEEVKARQGTVIAICTEGDKEMKSKADFTIEIPRTMNFLMPILAVIPLQLLAYHIAVMRGCDVDQPRNLAKSVTVE
ncbi:glutamine--fructose-6-phosphate transaminase (isomerizing) [candidate division LCP-89 bacterium B3_LCP]|uniref:Glutamine--fructose-6-phosphate aminotransferase [isomerizing] n=1 Tax=candidate division LCP-89 bacterium B3_LCP TaxID=2012998 RepID=A0A532UY58_UNCL8|nr:MAG: glutamine--fructose-6-phosphate transaminase (isomerizing) [candidate division LCP-89 bacterium B3_LCP]